jgi:hypothetical protein
MRSSFLGLLVCVLACSGGPGDRSSQSAAADEAAQPPTSVASQVTVLPDNPIGTVLPGMAGLSYEKLRLASGVFTTQNSSLVSLFSLLGSSVLRIGGDTADETAWSLDSTTDPTAKWTVTPEEVDALASFLQATGWRVIYGLNMQSSNASTAADEAAYARGALGTSLMGFEIGNEPDLYTWSHGGRGALSDFEQEWESFASAIAQSSGASCFTGPASALRFADWTVPFAAKEASSLSLLTQHYYLGDRAYPLPKTMDTLLHADPSVAPMLQALGRAAGGGNGACAPMAPRLAECSNFVGSGSGIPGLSNSFGSALWVIDFLFANAQNGSAGINLHGGGVSGTFTPIADDGGVFTPQPIYYGMLLFSWVGTGQMVATQMDVPAGLNASAYAVVADSGVPSVVIVNKNATTTLHTSVDFGGPPLGAASVMRLQAHDLGATTGVTFGGAGITADATWSPAFEFPMMTGATTTLVDVPPASAALVQGWPEN